MLAEEILCGDGEVRVVTGFHHIWLRPWLSPGPPGDDDGKDGDDDDDDGDDGDGDGDGDDDDDGDGDGNTWAGIMEGKGGCGWGIWTKTWWKRPLCD